MADSSVASLKRAGGRVASESASMASVLTISSGATGTSMPAPSWAPDSTDSRP